jgi:hypothetical protein
MIRDHYKNTEIRKAELDPSTFAQTPDWVRQTPREYNPWGMRLVLAWCLAALCLGGWALWTLVEPVL